MSERQIYEGDWARCDNCGTRRKLDALAVKRVDESTVEVDDRESPTGKRTKAIRTNVYACTDLGWCSKAHAERQP